MRIFIPLLILTVLVSCQQDNEYIELVKLTEIDQQLDHLLIQASNGAGKSFFILPNSDDLNTIPQDPLNRLTPEKIALGKLLLHDPATGGNAKNKDNQRNYSCVSCHSAASGFSSGMIQGIGEGGMGFGVFGEGRVVNPAMNLDSIDVQPLRSPTLLNLAYQDVMLWDGKFGATGTNRGTEAQWQNIPDNKKGFEGIEVQAMVGQDVHRLKIDSAFAKAYGYEALFDAAFPEVSITQRYTRQTAALAIAAFERTLLANRAPWQEYLKGNTEALSLAQKRGAVVFFDQGRCYECHSGPALKDKDFYAFAMADFKSTEVIVQKNMDMHTTSLGRGGFTKNPEDNYKFKTPTLYNLVDNGIYGHGGSFNSLRDVIAYKNAGVAQKSDVPRDQLAPQFGNLNLSEHQIDDLTAFIAQGLRDPDLRRYVPQAVNSGMCFPNNDAMSRKDQGCE